MPLLTLPTEVHHLILSCLDEDEPSLRALHHTCRYFYTITRSRLYETLDLRIQWFGSAPYPTRKVRRFQHLIKTHTDLPLLFRRLVLAWCWDQRRLSTQKAYDFLNGLLIKLPNVWSLSLYDDFPSAATRVNAAKRIHTPSLDHSFLARLEEIKLHKSDEGLGPSELISIMALPRIHTIAFDKFSFYRQSNFPLDPSISAHVEKSAFNALKALTFNIVVADPRQITQNPLLLTPSLKVLNCEIHRNRDRKKPSQPYIIRIIGSILEPVQNCLVSLEIRDARIFDYRITKSLRLDFSPFVNLKHLTVASRCFFPSDPSGPGRNGVSSLLPQKLETMKVSHDFRPVKPTSG